jgi:hypothetical protein
VGNARISDDEIRLRAFRQGLSETGYVEGRSCGACAQGRGLTIPVVFFVAGDPVALVPAADSLALLINPTSAALAEAQSKDLQVAARALGLRRMCYRPVPTATQPLSGPTSYNLGTRIDD